MTEAQTAHQVFHIPCHKPVWVAKAGDNAHQRIVSPHSCTAQSGLLTEIDVAGMLRDGIPEVEFHLQDFLVARTLTYLTGPAKSFKTWLAMVWAICLATGKSFLGLNVWGQHKILFIEAENAWQIPRRFALLCAGLGVNTDDALKGIKFVKPERFLRLNKPDQAAEVCRVAREYGATWVVIDSFVRVHGLNENSSQEMSELADEALLPLRDQAGCGVLVLVQA